MKPERMGYTTKRSLNSDEMTSLEDTIRMGDIAEDIPVSSIIDTKKGLLCYAYDDIEQL